MAAEIDISLKIERSVHERLLISPKLWQTEVKQGLSSKEEESRHNRERGTLEAEQQRGIPCQGLCGGVNTDYGSTLREGARESPRELWVSAQHWYLS